MSIPIRTRYFFAVEGESEQSLIRWLQMLSDGRTPVHLDSYVLNGGGFESMLEAAVRKHDRQARGKTPYRERFLVVDADRDGQDIWSLEKLRQEATRHRFIVIVQKPRLEGLLYRMTPGKERDIPSAITVETKLRVVWPSYRKPADARMLNGHFSLEDLMRVAAVDSDLTELLRRIGLI